MCFKKGLIEKLGDAESLRESEIVDVIVSNCVINLCPDKEAVLRECHRLLKPGGDRLFKIDNLGPACEDYG